MKPGNEYKIFEEIGGIRGLFNQFGKNFDMIDAL